MPVEVFDALSARYDTWYEKNKELYLKELSIVPKPTSPSLEVGVGSGRFAAPLGIDVGLDPSIPMLELAKLRGVECVAGDALKPPFRNRSFITIYLIFTLCFIRSPLSVLKILKNLLAPSGALVACIIPADSGLGMEYMKKDSPFYRVARFFTVSEFEHMIAEAGYRVQDIKSVKIKYGEDDFICYVLHPSSDDI